MADTPQFVHLHLHSQYSFLDGAIKINDLIDRAVQYNMPAVAITDHGNMHGAIDFYQKAKKKGLKPIIGCEMYLALDGRTNRTRRDSTHLVLLARNNTGYRNLCYLNSKAWLEGHYYDPRIDHELLAANTEGLIGLSACLGGEIPGLIRKGNLEGARAAALRFKEMFEPGCFFLEIMRNGFDELKAVNEELVKIGQELDIPLVATNDCHYLDREDAYGQEVLMAISTGKTMDDDDRIRHNTDELFFKPPEVMAAQFADLPQCVENTLRIADMCNLDLDLGTLDLPEFPIPEGYTLDTYFHKVAEEGLEARFAQAAKVGRTMDKDHYLERLNTEINIINTMGFPGYFLIVWDFIKYAKENGIMVGPGRGSGAGSLVAYSLSITDIDPIPYKLLFERFLNPERVSMPDFDVDFCQNRRDEVIKYVTEKYGADNVAQIATFAELKAKSGIRDVGRALGMAYGEVDGLAKKVPDGPRVTLQDAVKDRAFREVMNSSNQYQQLVKLATSLEGLNRQAGMHAAGIVIGNQPLWEYCPLFRGPEGEQITQYDKHFVEEVGLIKFDFLGLTTLTVIDEAVRHVNRARKQKGEALLDLTALSTDDPAVYAMISKGDTKGVFQFESSGFTDLIKRYQPDRFEDLIALAALFRPGPIGAGMVDDFVNRKHGRQRVEYPHPALEEILSETFGTIIFQEQVMQIARTLAGFSLGQADILRKAMGKKDDAVMAKQKGVFLDGAAQVGLADQDKAGQIFDMMAEFAQYGFNKSHSAAYALVSYQTAWLKCHYPVEFMAALLSSSMNDQKKIVRYINEAKEMGVEVLPPDVNHSHVDFSVDNGRIRFGLGAIKGVGEAVVSAILEARAEGNFVDLLDFCERVEQRRVNRRTMEALTKCGAFDSMGVSRARVFAALPNATETAQRRIEERNSPQIGLFSLMSGSACGQNADGSAVDLTDSAPFQYPEVEDWTMRQRLNLEKEYLGFYLTGHPLDSYRNNLSTLGVTMIEDLSNYSDGASVTLAGVVTELRERRNRRGTSFNGFAIIEDLSSRIEVLCFGETYAQGQEVLAGPDPVLISGNLLIEDDDTGVTCKLRARHIKSLSAALLEMECRVQIVINVEQFSTDTIHQLGDILKQHQGTCPIMIKLLTPGESEVVMSTGPQWAVETSAEFMEAASALLGPEAVLLIKWEG